MRTWLSTIAATLAVSLLGASAASAATEFGDPCVATQGTSTAELTLFEVSTTASPLPLTAPTAGVITSWKLNLAASEAIPAIIPQTLKVLRVNTSSHNAQVVGEASGLVGSGGNTIPARIPVQAGDRLGVFGHGPITYKGSTSEVGTLYCKEEAPGTVIGVIAGNPPTGASAPFEEGPSGIRTPAVAVLEPDADNDGYGDETQDKCPQSAATQLACPLIALSSRSVVKRGLVTLFITASSQAPVTVAGTVKLGKGKTAKLSGGTQVVAPGTLSKFTLLFPQKLREALKALSGKHFLTLALTATAPNIVGAPTAQALNVRVKGQAKPKKHSHKAPRG